MPIYRKSELFPFLKQLGIHPRKGLSQNFLIDGNIINKIIALSEVSTQTPILEIGPGPGAVTESLLNLGTKVIAVELDALLAEALKRFDGKLAVYHQDILDFNLDELQIEKGKVIANLPYHITTPILAKLMPRRELFSTLTLMVQEEMARRITASPNTSDYGSLTLFVNYFAKAIYGFKVSRHSFWPEPSIDSAVIHLTLHAPPKVKDEESLFKMIRHSFQQRRKMLRSSLQTLYPKERIVQELEKLNLKQTARPQELALKSFIELHQKLST